ncbi:GNAT family N-acetyltransferase [Balneatrix alpica]|uniref:GNAT family N-acetyltransferase n=1 Tax=Balneatrix alpica TaxID=75684 RepID=A0ABV5ZGU2_9GAMM|nr:GNAT family N-acetyltransferase [Balneatrix alpica]
MNIQLESPNQADVLALIAALDAYQDSLYPPECRYALDLTALQQPQVVFAVARDAQQRAQACGAIVLNPGYAELKRMYVSPECRGQGVAKALLALLEAQAIARGASRFTLETGPLQPEALAFYQACGYRRCGPFGTYRDDPMSVFMSKGCLEHQHSPSTQAESF